MAREKITANVLKRTRNDAKAKGEVFYVWDTEPRGFGIRASPTATSWLVQKRKGPRGTPAVRVVVGHYPPVELEQARELAGKKIADVFAGVDLRKSKRKARAKQVLINQAPTLQDCVVRFIADQPEPDSDYWRENRLRFDNVVLPALGAATKITSISRAEIRHLLENTSSTRKLFVLLRPFFKWLEGRGDIPASPVQGLMPPRPPKKRERKLNDAELKAFWHATDQMPTWRPYYRLLLLTAQRREEVAGMRWPELELHCATWTIPANRTKNGKEHIVRSDAACVGANSGCWVRRQWTSPKARVLPCKYRTLIRAPCRTTLATAIRNTEFTTRVLQAGDPRVSVAHAPHPMSAPLPFHRGIR